MAIVTGGAGTIGGAVCRALLAADWRVASVDRVATELGQLADTAGSSERALAMESPLMRKFERAQPGASEAVRRWYTSQTPFGRYCLPEEVASVVPFLLSSAARFMNGATVTLDGGLTATGRPAT